MNEDTVQYNTMAHAYRCPIWHNAVGLSCE